jgi:hypothetical protein
MHARVNFREGVHIRMCYIQRKYKSVLTKLRRNQVGTFYNLFYRDIVQANRFAFFFQEKVEAQASRLLGNTPLD